MTAQTSNENGVQTDGFAIVEDVLPRQKVDALLHALERIGDTGSVRKRGGIFAVRNLLDVSAEVRELADSDAVRVLVEPILRSSFLSRPRHSVRQDSGRKLEGSVAPGRDDCGAGTSRSRWLWTMVDEGGCAPRPASGSDPGAHAHGAIASRSLR